MANTADDLIDEVASIIGRNVPGEALSAIDHDTIDAVIDRVLGSLTRIVSIPDRDDIPDDCFQEVAAITAIYAAPKFSNGAVNYDDVRWHEQRLREILAQKPPRETLEVDYF